MRKQGSGLRSLIFPAALSLLAVAGCGNLNNLNTFEKHVVIPGHNWNDTFRPNFSVNISDTSARYNIDVTLRHTGAYPFSNLWVLISSAFQGNKPVTQRVELPLADKQGRWLASGMDNIFLHRIPIQRNARFDKAGTYHFTIEQNMRINPLPDVMSVGLRIEKVPR